MEGSAGQTDRTEVGENRKTTLLERMREDLRAGRHHPRGFVSAELIRTWGFARVMKHIPRIREIFERVEAEELALLERRKEKAARDNRYIGPFHPALMEKEARARTFRRRDARTG